MNDIYCCAYARRAARLGLIAAAAAALLAVAGAALAQTAETETDVSPATCCRSCSARASSVIVPERSRPWRC